MIDMYKNWNKRQFARLCDGMRRTFLKTGNFLDAKENGYDFTIKDDVYLYIADVVLKGCNCESETVRAWTNKNGPSKNKEGVDIRRIVCDFFYGTYEKIFVKEENENMDKVYSDFVKEKVFTVHQAIVNYLNNEEVDEDEFWELDRILDENRIAIPDGVSIVFESFITQYLEENLFGKVMRKDRDGEIDLSYIKDSKLKEWPNLKDLPGLEEWFKLRNIYDIIAEQYIKPILQG